MSALRNGPPQGLNPIAIIAWPLGLFLTGVPATILLLISQSPWKESSTLLARLDAAERGTSQERLVHGTVRVPPDQEPLVSPVFARKCVAWEAELTVKRQTRESRGKIGVESRTMRTGGAASRFDVDDPQAGLLATIDEPRFKMLGEAETSHEPLLPAWSSELKDIAGPDSSEPRRWYEALEWTLKEGDEVSLFGVAERDGSPRLRPSPGDGRMLLFFGSPAQWRENALDTASTARTMRFVASGFTLGFAILLSALVLSVVKRRRERARWRASQADADLASAGAEARRPRW
ncbi:MAG: hypothetical protein AB1938_20130 [Myxococcota bacterium]